MSSTQLTTNKNLQTLNLEDLHLSEENRTKINQLIEEFDYLEALKPYNLPMDNKILLHGSTGCGKTATANAIAKRLNKKLITLHLGGFVSSRLGETAKNITAIFRDARLENAVLFIDEFDFVGRSRDESDKDSGEMRRLVNALLQQIDALDNNTLLIGATNYIEAIDEALLRRFQLKLAYNSPTKEQLDLYYESLFKAFPKAFLNFDKKFDISYAEAKDYTFQKIKENIIKDAKQKKELLFIYDAFQLNEKQWPTNVEKSLGKKDKLEGYRIDEKTVNKNPTIEKTELKSRATALKTQNKDDYIDGEIFEITLEDLRKTDLYHAEYYKRMEATFASGTKAWLYIKK